MVCKGHGREPPRRRRHPPRDASGPSSYRGEQNLYRLIQEIANISNSRPNHMESTLYRVKEKLSRYSEVLQAISTTCLHSMHLMSHMLEGEVYRKVQIKAMTKAMRKLSKAIRALHIHFKQRRNASSQSKGARAWLKTPLAKDQKVIPGTLNRSISV
eukprot:Gb_03728 [translate_table: standard]